MIIFCGNLVYANDLKILEKYKIILIKATDNFKMGWGEVYMSNIPKDPMFLEIMNNSDLHFDEIYNIISNPLVGEEIASLAVKSLQCLSEKQYLNFLELSYHEFLNDKYEKLSSNRFISILIGGGSHWGAKTSFYSVKKYFKKYFDKLLNDRQVPDKIKDTVNAINSLDYVKYLLSIIKHEVYYEKHAIPCIKVSEAYVESFLKRNNGVIID